MLVSGAVFCRGGTAVVCDTGRTLSLLAVMIDWFYISGVGGVVPLDDGLVLGVVGSVGLCIHIVLCVNN